MPIEYFLIDQIKREQTISKKIVSSVAESRGATFQKINQLFDSQDRRSLIHEKKTTEEVLKLLEKYSPDLYKEIHSISSNFFQGSIAYVHRVKLNDGSDLAIKTLRPNIVEKIEKDIEKSSSLTHALHKYVDFKDKYDINHFAKKFTTELKLECDLEREHINHSKLSQLINKYKYIKLPKVYSPPNKQYIAYEWIQEDIPVSKIHLLQEENKVSIANELTHLFFYQSIAKGYIQEDSNLSNFLIKNGSLYIIDFGKIEFIPQNHRLNIIHALSSISRNSNYNYLFFFKELGFDLEKLQSIEKKLPYLFELLFMPYLVPNKANFTKWKLSKKINNILGDSKWIFRSSAPYLYFKLIRSFVGPLKILNSLGISIKTSHYTSNLNKEFEGLINNLNIPVENLVHNIFTNKILSIKVQREGEEKIALNLPASIIYELNDYLSDRIKKKIKKYNIDLKELIDTAINEQSEIILDLKDKNERFLVSLKKG